MLWTLDVFLSYHRQESVDYLILMAWPAFGLFACCAVNDDGLLFLSASADVPASRRVLEVVDIA